MSILSKPTDYTIISKSTTKTHNITLKYLNIIKYVVRKDMFTILII